MRKGIYFFIMMVSTLCAMAQPYRLVSNINYIGNDTSVYRKERCKLDVYYPEGRKNFKTVIWFHGGALEGGNKFIPDELKGQGIAVVAPNYRLSPRSKCPDYISDAAAAVAWTVEHIGGYGGNASEIYISGHSAGGYLAMMLALDKSYLAEYGIDADSIKGYIPIGGQAATHYTIRKERGISFSTPVVDKYAPLNNVRVLDTRLWLVTGDRALEQMARYEENLYLKSVLEGIGNKNIPLYELNGFNHGEEVFPGCRLIIKMLDAEDEKH